MTCVHLQQLVQLCSDSQIKLSSSDLIHMVCEQCGKKEVCPSALYEDFGEEPAEKIADPQAIVEQMAQRHA